MCSPNNTQLCGAILTHHYGRLLKIIDIKDMCWCLVCCRIDVEQFKNVDRQDFLEKYTSLVQRLSLLLLQVWVTEEH
jgi:hypothetical protein